uniref:Cytochrome c oxidase subunit 2 n=1 Tax=Scolytinae sp. BMNH 1274282 TaxID=2558034 RepID=A0A126TF55_9CUCU|nr:cytochrome c oxidase subunit II [Scolytinae sp. BMNH 1274282]
MLQDSACPMMEQLMFFHDHALLILTVITILVGQMLMSMLFNKFTHRFLLEGQLIETIWTILPALVLVTIAMPSLRLLYLLDDVHNPTITIKTIAHQWYWSYEYSDYSKIEFDSYMIPLSELTKTSLRLLDVNNRLIIPFNTQVRMMITSADVIHSWTIPSLGVKIDGTPGRLNQSSFNITRPGLFFGQCSEICGANHSFMPIVIESISSNQFLKWANSTN